MSRDQQRAALGGLILAVAVCSSREGIHAQELPDHYFVGRVCRGGKETQMKPPNFLCDKPVRGATVTIRNSLAQVFTTTTDAEGYYSLPIVPLNGTDLDTVTFEAKNLVGLRVGPLHFDPATRSAAKLGCTITLPKQRVERVTIH